MANTEETKVEKQEKGEKMVEIMVPLMPGQKGDIHPSVNGRAYTIKRGEYVKVPWYIAEAIQNGLREEQKVLRRIEELRTK